MKCDKLIQAEESLKQTTPGWHPGVDSGETSWCAANRCNPMWVPCKPNHGPSYLKGFEWCQQQQKPPKIPTK